MHQNCKYLGRRGEGGVESCLNIVCLKKIPISAAFIGVACVLQEFTLRFRPVGNNKTLQTRRREIKKTNNSVYYS